MSEEVVTFGPEQTLIGILSLPETRKQNSPVVVMWNVGLNHRVGPSRAWVELARRLSAHGIPSLRFDVSGLGDSPSRSGPSSDIERAKLDLRDALAYLETRVESRFVLVSNCSGTDAAHPTAVSDTRITAAVFLDGYCYPTPRYRLHVLALRFLTPRVWLRHLRKHHPWLFGLELDPTLMARYSDDIYVRDYPPRRDFERDLERMVDRGVRLLYAFSGETSYAYANQFWDSLRRKDWKGLIELEYYPDANHTYSYQVDRERMLARVISWLVARV